ncbi:MAG: GNAT family N-acetyltransferase [Pseudomonadales bacterium]|nr:GNAT family N-acetyltransferase [Pseudomonadales bacterium]
MNELTFRKATVQDMDWLYALFRSTMKHHIEQTWGWDELFQKHGFAENLPASSFTIALLDQEAIGAYSLMEKTDHLWLDMLLLPEQFQGRGLGSRLLETIQKKALARKKPLRLSVLKINSAHEFYLKRGFVCCGEDDWSLKLEWRLPS